jgi:hypothetical protein
MSPEQTQLLEKLALMMGTTVEHLWGVLIRQAPVSSGIILLWMVSVGIGLIWLWKITLRQTNDESKVIGCIILGIISMVFITAYGSNMPLIMAGFFNPEYWALNHFLHP